MSGFDEFEHPRVQGRFTDKDQSAAEVEISSFIAEPAAPFDLAEDEILTLSHAEGDFGADEFGVEGIDLFLDPDDGHLRAQAYTDLDFTHLADIAGVSAPQAEQWLTENREAIERSFATVYLDTRFDDRNGTWEAQVITVDILPADGELLPYDADGVIARVKAAPAVTALFAGMQSEDFWAKIHDAMPVSAPDAGARTNH